MQTSKVKLKVVRGVSAALRLAVNFGHHFSLSDRSTCAELKALFAVLVLRVCGITVRLA
jgi:hypothetical protein